MENFNEDISGWDTGNVTNMYGMFYNARSFNQDLSNWDVSGSTNLNDMFEGTDDLSDDINGIASKNNFSSTCLSVRTHYYIIHRILIYSLFNSISKHIKID